MPENKKIFALDIGTRSVVGIILEKADDHYHVVEILSKEHIERSMLDGQIHDVEAVSKVITEIKTELEKKYGAFHKVCVAAAGRSLKTQKAKATVDIHGKPLLKKEDILHLELSAIQNAQAIVAEKFSEKEHYYYCVGYSVLYYRLDEEEIGNLIDQQGSEASVEIIATFLPKVVVESLLAALSRSGLEMEALTLEPIAAINVLIPPSMRRLNVALVDIGAGTSDIAITNLGTIVAYGMVPVAGDEITEAISDQFLLDFPLAERAKRELYDQDSITLTDILGFETEIAKDDVIEQISTSLDHLATSIGSEILRLNNNLPPKAVMLVGGGSLTPELPLRVAKFLDLPANRVAIRGIDAISSLTIESHIHRGPELVTPIGIAIAAHKMPVHYVTVYVNEQPIRLFEIKKLTVGDCLLAAGIKMNMLYGKPGMAKIISLNGKAITIPGKLGEPPTILKNGSPSSLDDEVLNGEQIFVKKGKDGDPADLQIKDLIDHISDMKIILNEQIVEIHPEILCNGRKTNVDKIVEDRDELIVYSPKTVNEVLEAVDSKLISVLKPFKLTINGEQEEFASLKGNISVNGMQSNLNESVKSNDRIMLEEIEVTVEKIAELKGLKLAQSIPVFFNDEKIILSKKIVEITRGQQEITEDDLIYNGDEITINQKGAGAFIFQDLFSHVEIKTPEKINGAYTLLKNGEPSTFYEPIAPGDQLNIVWPQITEA